MKNKAREKIENILKRRVLLLDGATGTELQKKGMPQGVCPQEWTINNPKVLEEIHYAYYKAGADVILTNTFGGNRLKLGEFGIKDVVGINQELVYLAKKSVGEDCIIAGDIGPTGKLVEPFGELYFEEAVNIFKEQIKALVKCGVDILIIETMIDIQEARAALIAAKEISSLFTIVTMSFDDKGCTLNGTDPVTALITIQSLGADAFGCNCSTGPKEMIKYIKAMKPYAKVPLVAKPNAGMPKLINDRTVYDMDVDLFSSFGRELFYAGANILGGCCGTTPQHIKRLRKTIKNRKPIMPKAKAISALTSYSKTVFIEDNSPLVIVGEEINPTGKSYLQKELREGKFSVIRQMAKKQEDKGVKLLDVNVCVPGIDEAETMRKTINFLCTVTRLPLVIDSAKVEVIEKALRLYPGRALINSLTAEKHKLKKILSLASEYGAMFIALPITDKGLPHTFSQRKNIINRIIKEAVKYGFTYEDIIVDALTLAVSTYENAAKDVLETIDWCYQKLKLKTIIGLSNISFGLPQRNWLNATFLAMAQAKGLCLAILNPKSLELMNVKISADLLLGKDKDAKIFLKHFSANSKIKSELTDTIQPKQKVFNAIVEGDRDNIIDLLKQAINTGIEIDKLMEDIMIPAIRHVGELFENKEYFLPQLIASAQVMEKAFGYLKPHLESRDREHSKKPTIIIATVKGDIHDIGKNIVALLLRNYGFNVIDLGKDVPNEKIVREAKYYKPFIIGLSALMTTTMVRMKEVIELAKKEGVNCHFIVGGAVVNLNYAKSIGAFYAKDGISAVKVIEDLIS
ncbi:MAG: homocysteine S-methyltransferase family protein [Candidatus Omnitrophica bacterium]|nr:homocysteine S-methyltransferase family protein [Candidatus Omnitrophota bacterium]